jgi:hypothetical protein
MPVLARTATCEALSHQLTEHELKRESMDFIISTPGRKWIKAAKNPANTDTGGDESISGFYTHSKRGVTFFDLTGSPFAFLVAHRPGERFFVSCGMTSEGLRYLHSTSSIDDAKLGIEKLGYADSCQLARTIIEDLALHAASAVLATANITIEVVAAVASNTHENTAECEIVEQAGLIQSLGGEYFPTSAGRALLMRNGYEDTQTGWTKVDPVLADPVSVGLFVPAEATSTAEGFTAVLANDLNGLALNWAVATADGIKVKVLTVADQLENVDWSKFTDYERERLPGLYDLKLKIVDETGHAYNNCPAYSTDWNAGGPLIKKYRVDIEHYDQVYASCRYQGGSGPSFRDDDELVAVCRAVVAVLLGESVLVPNALVAAGQVRKAA